MTDISTLFEYDKPFTVELKRRDNGKPLGIKFNMVSVESERVVNALRKIDAERWKSEVVGEEFDVAAHIEKQEVERLIAAIDSWDWGGNEFGSLGVDPACSEENKRYVVTHPNAKWIRDQLSVGCIIVENFTQPSPESVPTT